MITPYIESERVREKSTLNFSGSGIDTRDIDSLRQGINVRNSFDRFAGTLPDIGSGDESHVIEVVTYGQSDEFNFDTKWSLVDVFDPVTFIENQNSLIFPLILQNQSVLDPERAGGFIEPFDISARSLVQISGKFLAHDIRADLQDGNIDSFGKSDVIVSTFKNNDDESIADAYIDSTEYLGELGGDVIIPGFFPDDERQLKPYDETIVFNKTVYSGTINSDDIKNAIFLSTGSSTDDHLRSDELSAGTGITYDNSIRGIDSLAFGGLKR